MTTKELQKQPPSQCEAGAPAFRDNRSEEAKRLDPDHLDKSCRNNILSPERQDEDHRRMGRDCGS